MAVRTEEGADPSGAWTGVIGITGAVLTLGIIVGLQALYNHVERDEMQRKVYDAVSDQLTRARADQLATINSYKWIDAEKGIAAIPIEVAMEKVVADLRGAPRATSLGPGVGAPGAHGATGSATSGPGGADAHEVATPGTSGGHGTGR